MRRVRRVGRKQGKGQRSGSRRSQIINHRSMKPNKKFRKRAIARQRVRRELKEQQQPQAIPDPSSNSSHTSLTRSYSPIVSVIIPVLNERKTIREVVMTARRIHPRTEVVVVSNGTTDGSDRIAERAGARVIRFEKALGHDVGRKVGAEASSGAVLLFIDGDMVLRTSQMRPFVQAIWNGADVALNNYSGPTQQNEVHPVILAKYALNALLLRSEFKGISMTAVPHAMSRKALATIGVEYLAVPPVAHAIALHKGLLVTAPASVPVGKLNSRRPHASKPDPLERIIDNDHMQAVRWLLEQTNRRGGLTDLNRQRQLVR